MSPKLPRVTCDELIRALKRAGFEEQRQRGSHLERLGYGSAGEATLLSEHDKTSISKATTIEGIAEFWDTHSLADYWDQTREVDVEVLAQQRRRVVIDPEVYERLAQLARKRGLHPETLINMWLAERLAKEKAA